VRMEGVVFAGGGGGDGNEQVGEDTRKINGTAAEARAPGDDHAKRSLWKLMTDIDIKSD
jgi:hypothetical protein